MDFFKNNPLIKRIEKMAECEYLYHQDYGPTNIVFFFKKNDKVYVWDKEGNIVLVKDRWSTSKVTPDIEDVIKYIKEEEDTTCQVLPKES